MGHSGDQSQVKINGTGINARKWHYHILTNRNCFYIQHALILFVGRQYRLIVYHGEKVLIDKTYKTLRGPKIAFSKLYRKRAFNDSIIPRWSKEIPGDLKALDPQLPLEILEGIR